MDANRLELFKAITNSIAVLLIPVLIAVVGNSVSSAINERNVQGKFVELAIDVLREEPKPEDEGLRKWSIDVLDKYSGVPVSQQMRAELTNKTPLPPRSPTNDFSLRFPMGSTRLMDSDLAQIRTLVKSISKCKWTSEDPVVLDITGYTDNTPFVGPRSSGPISSNAELGVARAEKVAELIRSLADHRNIEFQLRSGRVEESTGSDGRRADVRVIDEGGCEGLIESLQALRDGS